MQTMNRREMSKTYSYFADSVCSDSEQPLLNGVPPGHRMEGQFFPLVYDPAWAV